MIKELKVYKNVWYKRKLPHNLVFVFQMENGQLEKRKNVEYLQHHLTDFHQVFINPTVWPSNSCKSRTWKCRSRSKFTNMIFFKQKYF